GLLELRENGEHEPTSEGVLRCRTTHSPNKARSGGCTSRKAPPLARVGQQDVGAADVRLAVRLFVPGHEITAVTPRRPGLRTRDTRRGCTPSRTPRTSEPPGCPVPPSALRGCRAGVACAPRGLWCRTAVAASRPLD